MINKKLIKDSDKSIVKTTNSNEGLKALTIYKVKENIGDYTLLSLQIKTGRTHQIRVHLSSINHPIIGDAKYGDFELNKSFKNRFKWENQFLHANKISFEGIEGCLSYLNDIDIECPLPHENILLLDKLRSEI